MRRLHHIADELVLAGQIVIDNARQLPILIDQQIVQRQVPLHSAGRQRREGRFQLLALPVVDIPYFFNKSIIGFRILECFIPLLGVAVVFLLRIKQHVGTVPVILNPFPERDRMHFPHTAP
ncbi:hypothetical protein ABD76_21925 [Paenibacillus dendritiformis]|nr:hypothetical protein [Paenibacillus dendritiformis]